MNSSQKKYYSNWLFKKYNKLHLWYMVYRKRIWSKQQRVFLHQIPERIELCSKKQFLFQIVLPGGCVVDDKWMVAAGTDRPQHLLYNISWPQYALCTNLFMYYQCCTWGIAVMYYYCLLDVLLLLWYQTKYLWTVRVVMYVQ